MIFFPSKSGLGTFIKPEEQYKMTAMHTTILNLYFISETDALVEMDSMLAKLGLMAVFNFILYIVLQVFLLLYFFLNI